MRTLIQEFKPWTRILFHSNSNISESWRTSPVNRCRTYTLQVHQENTAYSEGRNSYNTGTVGFICKKFV